MNRVLIAEPDPVLRKLFGIMLRTQGIESDYVLSSTQLLKKSSEEAYVMAVVDWNLAPKTGPEVIKEIRRLEESSQSSPLFIVATYTDNEVMEEMLDAGANTFLDKPFVLEPLKQIISSIINKKQHDDEQRG